MKFKEDGIGVEDLLKLIPEDLLLDLAKETNVDYQVKKLYGRNVFNLLLFALIEKERIGLRGLEAYQSVYEQCSQLYDESVLSLKYKITRVDSTMVCQNACKLEQGINVGSKKDGKKQIKYTINLTNMFPSSVEVFTEQSCISENLTIPKAILKVLDKRKDNVFVFDRGVSDRKVFCELDKNDCSFVTRVQVDARHVVVEDHNPPSGLVVGNLTVLKDQRVYLYRTGPNVVEHPFRLIQTKVRRTYNIGFCPIALI